MAGADDLPARSVLWKALGRAWAYPGDRLMASFASGLFTGLVEAAWARVAGPDDSGAAELRQALQASLAREIALAEEHTFLFDGRVRCPPYESSYLQDPYGRARNLSDLTRILEGLGLRLAPDTRDLVDHIGILMELVGHTLAREADLTGRGKTEAASGWRAVRRGLVLGHLGRWVDEFAARLEGTARLPFYPALARLTLRLRNLEREALAG